MFVFKGHHEDGLNLSYYYDQTFDIALLIDTIAQSTFCFTIQHLCQVKIIKYIVSPLGRDPLLVVFYVLLIKLTASPSELNLTSPPASPCKPAMNTFSESGIKL